MNLHHKGEEKDGAGETSPGQGSPAQDEMKTKEAEGGVETGDKSQQYYEQLLRLKADFENYRKRIEKEKPELIKWGKADMLLKLLSLYDMILSAHLHINKLEQNGNQNRALEADGSVEDASNGYKKQVKEIIKGLEMIFKEFSKVFESENVREIKTLGKPYDPMSSEIVSTIAGDDSNDGSVVEELQKGFYFGDKILRPARVRIAVKKTEEKNNGE
ncbi:MAG: nucleotide exchange factor GrpE [Elusimicrobia bacterium]|nr:nucleotide exchange factor GrpE [Elusimicrobiota bacterium]